MLTAEDTDPYHNVHPNREAVGGPDILVAYSISATVVGGTPSEYQVTLDRLGIRIDSLLVGRTRNTDILPLNTDFLGGIAVEIKSTVVTTKKLANCRDKRGR